MRVTHKCPSCSGAVSGGYHTLVQQVIQFGGKAVMSKNFSLQQAKTMAAMMIAAIALAGK